MTQYKLKDGRIAFVRSGIGPNAFKAFSKKPTRGKEGGYDTPHGIKSLEWRKTQAEAQQDLDRVVNEQIGMFKGAIPLSENEPKENSCIYNKTKQNANTTTETTKTPEPLLEQEGEGKIEEMNPEDLTVLDELQTRVAMDEDAIEDYCNLIRNGMSYKFPPLEAIKDTASGLLYLYDGFHRLAAYKRVADEGDYQTVMVRWRPGTLEDALWYAIAANQEHGIRRTNEDKRKAVQKALEHPRGKELSDRAIADWVGVSKTFIANMRKPTGNGCQLTRNQDKNDNNWQPLPVEPATRVGKDGKRRKLPTRTSSSPSFTAPPGAVGKGSSTPLDWFQKPEKELSKKDMEKLRSAFQQKINEAYDFLSENGIVTEYEHLDDTNLTLYKGSTFIGTFCVPFLPPHKMPEPVGLG